MIGNRNVTMVKDSEGEELVVINVITFKGRKFDWKDVKKYLKGYVGDFYKIKETSEMIYIGNETVKEFVGS